MHEMPDPDPSNASTLVRAWNWATFPVRLSWNTLGDAWSAITHEAGQHPMTWSAILILAGGVCLAAGKPELGAIPLALFGLLLMWRDMVEVT